MHPVTSYQLATTQMAELRQQAQHDALTRTRVSFHRTGRPHRLGQRLWTLLHAQVLLDGSASIPR